MDSPTSRSTGRSSLAPVSGSLCVRAKMDNDPRINQAWTAIRVVLQSEFSFYEIKELVGLAGMDLTELAHLVQKAGGGASKGQLMTAIDQSFARFVPDEKREIVSHLVQEVVSRRPDCKDRLEGYLARFGWGLLDDRVVPLTIFDPKDLEEITEAPRADLVKAAERIRDGDLSGAISAACAAVDTCTGAIYEEYQLGNVQNSSFQERCKKALDAVGSLQLMEDQLREIGWEDDRVAPFRNNFQGALNHGAYVMQTLRSGMGDVHGTKPILKPLVFDCLRWAEVVIRTLERK